MPFFKQQASEPELELIVLRVAMSAKARENETLELVPDDEIRSMITLAFNKMERKADADYQQYAFLGVQTLLAESRFLDEAIDYQVSHPGRPLPKEFREKMRAALRRAVSEYRSQS